MPKRKMSCKQPRCGDPAEIMGYCRAHYDEHLEDERLRGEAVRALHSGLIDGHVLANDTLRTELLAIQKWWRVACDAVNYDRDDTVLKDEAPYALEWCISLAKEIVLADEALLKGDRPDHSLEYTKAWVYDRFSNLEAGLMSNGVKRPER